MERQIVQARGSLAGTCANAFGRGIAFRRHRDVNDRQRPVRAARRFFGEAALEEHAAEQARYCRHYVNNNPKSKQDSGLVREPI